MTRKMPEIHPFFTPEGIEPFTDRTNGSHLVTLHLHQDPNMWRHIPWVVTVLAKRETETDLSYALMPGSQNNDPVEGFNVYEHALSFQALAREIIESGGRNKAR